MDSNLCVSYTGKAGHAWASGFASDKLRRLYLQGAMSAFSWPGIALFQP